MISEKIINGLRDYLKDHYIPPQELATEELAIENESVEILLAHLIGEEEYLQAEAGAVCNKKASFRDISNDASDYVKKHRKPGGFPHALDRIRKEKGRSPAELYKKANVDRRQYSRLMGPEGRHPSMNTVLCFGLALRLTREEFDGFLQTAGYSFSYSSTRDVCVLYCLENHIFDVSEVNALLFAIGVEPLTRE